MCSCLLSALQAKDASSIADILVPVLSDPSPLPSILPIIPIITQSFTSVVTLRDRGGGKQGMIQLRPS